MPYDRDQVVAAVTDYYDFLSRLHIKPEDIRRPPSGGWPDNVISQQRFSKLGMSAKVIDLLRHLPYVQNDDNYLPIPITSMCACSDYTGAMFQDEVEEGGHAGYIPMEEDPEHCTWEKWLKPHAHIVPIASGRVRTTADLDIDRLLTAFWQGRYAEYILVDTEDGEVTSWSPWDDEDESFSCAQECFSRLKKDIIDARYYPISERKIRPLIEDNDMNRQIKELLGKFGWPSEEFDWERFVTVARQKIEKFSSLAGYD